MNIDKFCISKSFNVSIIMIPVLTTLLEIQILYIYIDNIYVKQILMSNIIKIFGKNILEHFSFLIEQTRYYCLIKENLFLNSTL